MLDDFINIFMWIAAIMVFDLAITMLTIIHPMF